MKTALLLASAVLLSACATPVPLPPSRVAMFGEQHDQTDQQRQVAATVADLAARGDLGALVLEMAERGHDTRKLDRDATPEAVRQALDWKRWPWDTYADIVMTAVRAGVPVAGGNLPRASIKPTMQDATLEGQVGADVREKIAQAVRDGHCGMLPAGQEAPMVRVQIARDRSLAATLAEQAALAGPHRRVLLLAGAQHVSLDRGVPLHLDAALTRHVVIFGSAEDQDLKADDWRPAAVTWRPDPCADLRRRGLGPHKAP